jgi:hypothetical protein
LSSSRAPGPKVSKSMRVRACAVVCFSLSRATRHAAPAGQTKGGMGEVKVR